MSEKKIRPRLVFAGQDGSIYDHPDLYMLTRRGREFALPRPDELVALPPESELFLLPGRRAIGLDPETGEIETLEEAAVAAFVCPGYTLTGLASYLTDPGAPRLPLFAYGAVGFENGRFYAAAKRVTEDPRQVFTGIPRDRIHQGATRWLKEFPKNRLVKHLAGCALSSCCPAARNLALGRYEAPLPTAQACNARCVGCLSCQPEESGFPATQNRLAFRPTVQEIVEVMLRHGQRERKPIYSFGQGCEGEPLTEAELIAAAVAAFRKAGGRGTVNVNTNASRPAAMEPLAKAGLSSIRASLNSAIPEVYAAYHRPQGFSFAEVRDTVLEAKKHGLFVSLNLFFFPGVTDTETELDALVPLIEESRLDYIQLRNLNLDPELYLDTLKDYAPGPSMGFVNFRKRLKKACPWIEFGYFNPYLPLPAKPEAGAQPAPKRQEEH
jgi:pyruvate-formate lyase-activating enzyme